MNGKIGALAMVLAVFAAFLAAGCAAKEAAAPQQPQAPQPAAAAPTSAVQVPAKPATPLPASQPTITLPTPVMAGLATAAPATPTPKPVSAGDKPIPGGTLRVTAMEPNDYDCASAAGWMGCYTKSFTSITLTKYDFADASERGHGDFTVYPFLAESWDVSPDLLSVTFHLRDGVKWQNKAPLNGREVTAQDVAFSFRRYLEPTAPNRGYLGPLTSVEAVDDKTVVFHFANAYVPFLTYSAAGLFPIDAPEVLQEFGQFNTPDTVIGNGAWNFDQHVVGVQHSFTKNWDYFRGAKGVTGEALPYIDRVEAVFTRDDAVKMALYKSHKIDAGPAFFYWGYWSGDNDKYEALKKDYPDLVADFRNFSTSVAALYQLQAKVDRPPFDNQKLRQAVSMVIDRSCKVWCGTWGIVDAREVQSNNPWFVPLSELGPGAQYYPVDTNGNYVRDVAGARKLANEARAEMGLAPEAVITTTIHTANNALYFGGLMELMQSWLGDLNIKADLVVHDWPEWASTLGAYPYEFDGIQYNYGSSVLDVDGYFFRVLHPDGDKNKGNIDDPEVTALVEAQRAELDPGKRGDIVRQLQKILAVRQYEWRVPNYLSQEMYPAWMKDVGAHKSNAVGRTWEIAWMTADAPGRQAR